MKSVRIQVEDSKMNSVRMEIHSINRTAFSIVFNDLTVSTWNWIGEIKTYIRDDIGDKFWNSKNGK